MRIGGFNDRPHRVDLRQPAVLIDSDGVENEAFILDVSSSGFRLQVSQSLRVGELITLRVDRCDDFPARIVWALGDEAGGVFTSRVDHLEWTDAEEIALNSGDTDPVRDRRKGDDRRKEGQRRQGGRTSDRRQGDRRKGDLRE